MEEGGAQEMSNHVLVTGIHRSGTTFVGEVLAKSDGLFYFHETLNRNWGLEGVEHWFPNGNDEEGRYSVSLIGLWKER